MNERQTKYYLKPVGSIVRRHADKISRHVLKLIVAIIVGIISTAIYAEMTADDSPAVISQSPSKPSTPVDSEVGGQFEVYFNEAERELGTPRVP